MNKDDIIRMAREAGAMPVAELAGTWITYDEPLQRFAALVAAAEREACAKVCEDMSNTEANMNKTWRNGCSDSADAIRARGQA